MMYKDQDNQVPSCHFQLDELLRRRQDYKVYLGRFDYFKLQCIVVPWLKVQILASSNSCP